MLSVNISRDSLCVVIAKVQKNNERVIITSLITNKSIDEMSVVFVDDTDFFVNGEDIKIKMEKILRECIELFEAMGGKIQFKKIFYFAW